MNMKTRKVIAMMASVMMFGSVASACGDSNKENKTPHTTYSVDQINNMSNDELEAALENAAKEIEASDKAEQEAPAEENEGIDFWEDVEVTFTGAEGLFIATAEYVGDNQIIKDNVEFAISVTKGNNPYVIQGDSRYVNGYNEFVVSAWFDEEELKEQGVVLKKRRYEEPQSGKYPKLDKSADFCFFTVSGLGSQVEITDDTDTTPFAEALDSITKKVKEASNEYQKYEWAKDIEIYPVEFYLCKNTGAGTGYVQYVDKDGNFLSWVQVSYLNYFNADGSWCKEPWDKFINIGYMNCSSVLGIIDEALIKVDIG